jgi:hypothetical protein
MADDREHVIICTTFELSWNQGRLMQLLLSQPAVTAEGIEDRYLIASDAKMAVCRLRKKLKPFHIDVKTCYDVGYVLTPEMRDRARDLIARASPQPTTREIVR